MIISPKGKGKEEKAKHRKKWSQVKIEIKVRHRIFLIFLINNLLLNGRQRLAHMSEIFGSNMKK